MIMTRYISKGLEIIIVKVGESLSLSPENVEKDDWKAALRHNGGGEVIAQWLGLILVDVLSS